MDTSILVEQHKREKDDSARFKQRRLIQWNENYAMYRDKVVTNRLTQRQAINIPIMRETIQGYVTDADELPMLKFETRGRSDTDKNGEILLNEMWAYTMDDLNLEIKDNVDKKIVGLQGRSFKKWGWNNGKIFCDLIDPYDIDIDPRVNPLDIQSASYIHHKNIFRPLRVILANKKFLASAKYELKTYLDSKAGLIKAAENQEEYERRKERLTLLGVDNYDDYRATDVLVDINESYKNIWVPAEGRFVRHLVILAADHTVLYMKPLADAIGIKTVPIVSWADDPDLNDIWSDGKGDNVRTFNKVVNMYISQDLENRTYRNFGMYFYNTMNGTFQPRAFEAKPFGMYGVPGNPEEIVKQMRIEPLGDTVSTIEYMKNLIQSSVAQTPAQRGELDKDNKTLGEIELTFAKSEKRASTGAKQYRRAWKESGMIWYELLNANSSGRFKLYKKGRDGNMHKKEVAPSDWQTPEGYEVRVQVESEAQANDDMDLKKIAYVKNSFANNPVAIKIAKRKELELMKWDPEEVDEVMQAEEQSGDQVIPVDEGFEEDPAMAEDPNMVAA